MNKGVLVFIFLLGLSILQGCKTKEKISRVLPVFPLNENELVHRIDESRPDFGDVFFRRTLVKINSDRKNQRFKSNIWLKRDSFLRVSVLGPMGIEAARVNFKPEEVIVIDRMNRLVIYTGYHEVERRFGMSLDFEFLQNIFLNRPFSLFPDVELSDYHSGVDNRQYKLASLRNREYARLKKNRSGDIPVFHQLWIHPEHYYLRKSSFTSEKEDLDVDIQYDEFEKGDDMFYFPGSMSISGKKENTSIDVNFDFGNVSFEGENRISFRIPDKYEKIYR